MEVYFFDFFLKKLYEKNWGKAKNLRDNYF